jgi:hypothetical protein
MVCGGSQEVRGQAEPALSLPFIKKRHCHSEPRLAVVRNLFVYKIIRNELQREGRGMTWSVEYYRQRL